MSFQANLKTLSVPDVLTLLLQLRKTGLLLVVGPEREKGLVLSEGNIVYATSQESTKRIGSYLVELGLVSAKDLERVFGAGFGRGGYVGRRIVASGLVSAEDLAYAVRVQIADIVAEVIEWDEGAIYFDEVPLPFDVAPEEVISTRSVLFESSRKSDERALAREIFPDQSIVFRRVVGAAIPSELAPVESATIQRLDGSRSVAEVLIEAGGSILETAKAIQSLEHVGMVERVPAGLAPAAPDGVPEIRIFPVSPDVASRLFGVFQRSHSEDDLRQRLEGVVEKDPLLTAKLLKLLSLSNVSVCRADVSVSRMIEILGLFHVRSGLLPEAARGFLYPPPEWYRNDFWTHSHLVSVLARKLAVASAYPHPEEAHVAGLLHNLGAFLLFYHAPAEYSALIGRSIQERIDIEKLELDTFGVTHSALGGTYAEKWSFPPALSLAVKSHHRNYGPRTQTALLDCLTVALGAVESPSLRVGHHEGLVDASRAAARRLGLSREDVEGFVRDVKREVDSVGPSRGGRVPPSARPTRGDRGNRVLGR